MKGENKPIDIILDFLNQMEIYKVLTAVEAGIYNILREEIIKEFGNGDVDNLFEILSLFDKIYIDYLEKKSYFDKKQLIALRYKIITVYIEKIKNAPLEED